MIKGLYSAFTAMEAAWRAQDVLANNIANANTVGFKREVAATESFADILLSQQRPVVAPIAARIQDVVGQIGTGVFVAEFRTDFSGGEMEQTGRDLDLTVERGFFAVQGPDGTTYYTRAGRFGRDANGDLVTSQGHFVVGADGGHINVPAGAVAVDPTGVISTAAGEAGQIQVLDFAPAQLQRGGESYFTATAPGTPVDGGVRQGFLERSNSNMVEEMTTLMALQRTYQANQTVLARLDGTLDQAAGQLGSFGA